MASAQLFSHFDFPSSSSFLHTQSALASFHAHFHIFQLALAAAALFYSIIDHIYTTPSLPVKHINQGNTRHRRAACRSGSSKPKTNHTKPLHRNQDAV